jgi:hypothetical protein
MKIRQNHTFIGEIVQQVSSGHLAPAAFQRPYVWDANDVEAMFTSVLREYPLGSFMIWQPSEEVDRAGVSRGRLGPILAPAQAPKYDFGLVLDGQNRLATMAWAMAQYSGEIPEGIDYSEAERATWMSGLTLTADLTTKSILFVPEDESYSPTRMPVGALFEWSTAMTLLRKAHTEFGELADDAYDWFGDVVPGCIKRARVQSTTLENASVADAREAFIHICKVGKPIDPVHLEAALGWIPADEAPEPEEETPAPRPSLPTPR